MYLGKLSYWPRPPPLQRVDQAGMVRAVRWLWLGAWARVSWPLDTDWSRRRPSSQSRPSPPSRESSSWLTHPVWETRVSRQRTALKIRWESWCLMSMCFLMWCPHRFVTFQPTLARTNWHSLSRNGQPLTAVTPLTATTTRYVTFQTRSVLYWEFRPPTNYTDNIDICG